MTNTLPRVLLIAAVIFVCCAAVASSSPVLCNFDDDTDPLCETALAADWISLGGVASRYTPNFVSAPYSLYNNFSAAIGIEFDNEMDFDSAYIANVSTTSLNILGFLNDVEVANVTLNFDPNFNNTYILYSFDSSFDRIDKLHFIPFYAPFNAIFGTFSMDDASIAFVGVNEAPEPTVLVILAIGLGLTVAQRRRRTGTPRPPTALD